MYSTLEEKKIVFDAMGRAISKALPSIRSIELDIFKTEDGKTYEYIVVTFKGGAISVRNATINSMSANLYEISQLVNGGYYNEVETYQNLKGEKKWKKEIIALTVFIILMLALSLLIISKENQLEKLKEQVEMQSLYNELKLDYYEERYGVDLDDTPEDFKKFLYDNYRELYNYMEELENDKKIKNWSRWFIWQH